MSLANKGIPKTDKYQIKISLAKTDKNPPMFGQNYNQGAKLKMSLVKTRYNHPMNNKNHTPGTLTKISLAKTKKVFVYSKDFVSNEIILF